MAGRKVREGTRNKKKRSKAVDQWKDKGQRKTWVKEKWTVKVDLT